MSSCDIFRTLLVNFEALVYSWYFFLSIHQVPSVLLAPHHLLALFTLGVPSGLIMDCGFTETVVLPISFYDRQIDGVISIAAIRHAYC